MITAVYDAGKTTVVPDGSGITYFSSGGSTSTVPKGTMVVSSGGKTYNVPSGTMVVSGGSETSTDITKDTSPTKMTALAKALGLESSSLGDIQTALKKLGEANNAKMILLI